MINQLSLIPTIPFASQIIKVKILSARAYDNQIIINWLINDQSVIILCHQKSPQPEFVTDHIEHFHNSDLGGLFPCKYHQSLSYVCNGDKSDNSDKVDSYVVAVVRALYDR